MASSDIDLIFCRSIMKDATALVKKHFPRVNLVKDSWTYQTGRDQWEFHGPEKYLWYGTAGNAYEARYKGWMAWLATKGITNVCDQGE